MRVSGNPPDELPRPPPDELGEEVVDEQIAPVSAGRAHHRRDCVEHPQQPLMRLRQTGALNPLVGRRLGLAPITQQVADAVRGIRGGLDRAQQMVGGAPAASARGRCSRGSS